MRPTKVTANATSTSLTITGLSGTVRAGAAFLSTLTFTGGSAPAIGTYVVVSGATPSSFNGTWQVVGNDTTAVTLSYRTTDPGSWSSGGTIATAAHSPLVPLDWNSSPLNVGIGCITSGTVTYTVQHTFDDIYDYTILPVWIDQPATGINGKTANADGNYAFPPRATRVNTTAGTGSVAMTVIQGTAN